MADTAYTRVKICGVTRPEDAAAAVAAGCDAVGVILWAGSPRCIDRERAREIRAAVPQCVLMVGVFVNAERPEVEDAVEGIGLNAVQLCGRVPGNGWGSLPGKTRLLRAIGIGPESTAMTTRLEAVEDYLLDTQVDGGYGGTGKSFDWNLAPQYRDWGRIWLAGGLAPENVGMAIATARPFAVDVSSGVELSPGIKSHDLIRRFVAAVRDADSRLSGAKL
jgi:phosphoribosylanthranilate isomerase